MAMIRIGALLAAVLGVLVVMTPVSAQRPRALFSNESVTVRAVSARHEAPAP